MSNEPMLSVELRVLGKAPLGERYYLCECPKCGWVGSSEECTQDEVLCLQKAGDDRCYGEADEIDAARLLELMQSGAFEKPAAQHQGEPVAWVIGTADGNGADYYPGKGLDTLEIGAKLYAEQSAPVAVVMPERIQGYPAQSNHRSYNDGWNACLTKVARLNGVKS